MKSASNVLLQSLDCSRQAHRNQCVRRRLAVKLNELDHPTLERAFNLDTNIVITRQRNSGAQLFADVDVTLDVLKRNGRIGVQICADVDVTLVTRWEEFSWSLIGPEERTVCDTSTPESIAMPVVRPEADRDTT